MFACIHYSEHFQESAHLPWQPSRSPLSVQASYRLVCQTIHDRKEPNCSLHSGQWLPAWSIKGPSFHSEIWCQSFKPLSFSGITDSHATCWGSKIYCNHSSTYQSCCETLRLIRIVTLQCLRVQVGPRAQAVQNTIKVPRLTGDCSWKMAFQSVEHRNMHDIRYVW